MLWSPSNHILGDIDIVLVDGRYHLFSEAGVLNSADPADRGPRVVYHAVSDDMWNWQELPHAIECGPPGSPDAFYIFHLNVYVHDGLWYMFYTGLDIKGAGQKQTVMLATSRDGLTWTKRDDLNPVLQADPRFYEQAIPRQATYQEKDFGRLWFRDPYVVRDPQSGRFGMIVIARDLMRHPDDRGCIAWAESEDLLHWQGHPPLFSPGRFHTVETPHLFEHNGWWYLVYMSHVGWGAPPLTTDPYQRSGDFYAVSKHGLRGPYIPLSDEVLVGAVGPVRFAAQKTIKALDGQRYVYGWLATNPVDEPGREQPHRKPMALPKPIEFLSDGRMRVRINPIALRGTKALATPDRPIQLVNADAACWGADAAAVSAKSFHARSQALCDVEGGDLIVSARVRIERGSRAGLVIRTDRQTSKGLQIVADRALRRVEFGLCDAPTFIDCRGLDVDHEFNLTVVASGISIEVYYNDWLIIHQVRHTEQHGAVGFVVDKSEASFRDLRVSEC